MLTLASIMMWLSFKARPVTRLACIKTSILGMIYIHDRVELNGFTVYVYGSILHETRRER